MRYLVFKINALIILACISLSAQNFSEVSSSLGINHTFNQDLAMGGGAVFFDYDNDGWEDLYVTSGMGEDHLYKNMNGVSFQRVTPAWLEVTKDYYTIAVVSGDINNDGFRDLFVTTWGRINNGNHDRGSNLQPNLLFINNGDETFSYSDSNANGMDKKSFSMAANMLDYNNDKQLDIYVGNYVEKVDINFETGNITEDDCFANFLYRSNGNFNFSELAESNGANNDGCALAVMPTDYDLDNDQDIYIANDFGEYLNPNAVLTNNGSSFSDDSESTNMDVGIFAMGISGADYDKDGDMDYYITNLGRNVLIQNDGNQVFTDVTTGAGVENTYALDGGGKFTTGWGTGFVDIDNDSWSDIIVANGRVPAEEAIATGERDPNKLFMNNHNGTFADMSSVAGIDDENRARGLAYSDFDKDGDIDLFFVVQDDSGDANAKSLFYRNELNPNGIDGNNWVQFDLEGVSINRDAIGARAEITVNGEKQMQEVHGQGSHCSQHSLVLHFGLGSATTIDEVKVIWSDTSEQTFTNVAVNQRFSLIEDGNLSTSEIESKEKFNIYPNPTTDKLYIENIDSTEFEILSSNSKLVKTGKIEHNFIDVSSLPSGVYILRLGKDSYKFIKE